MKKHLPNILLVIIVLVNILFIGLYLQNNGLGLFFSTTGIIFLVLGIFIFIFFLSIDPGYGWIKPIDLTKNYIMIFTSMAICLVGIVLIVTGQHINELHVQSMNEKIRCQELIAGNAADILKKDWYSLRDSANLDICSIYLFQKKSDRNQYKIIATVNDAVAYTVGALKISSQAITQPLTANFGNNICLGVFEENIRIDFDRHQQLGEQVQFDVLITLSRDRAEAEQSKKQKTARIRLESKPLQPDQKSGSSSETERQVNDLVIGSGMKVQA